MAWHTHQWVSLASLFPKSNLDILLPSDRVFIARSISWLHKNILMLLGASRGELPTNRNKLSGSSSIFKELIISFQEQIWAEEMRGNPDLMWMKLESGLLKWLNWAAALDECCLVKIFFRFFAAAANPPVAALDWSADGWTWTMDSEDRIRLQPPAGTFSVRVTNSAHPSHTHPPSLCLWECISTRLGWFPALWRIFPPLWLTSCPAPWGDVPLYIISLICFLVCQRTNLVPQTWTSSLLSQSHTPAINRADRSRTAPRFW